jgi:hypothetical protein
MTQEEFFDAIFNHWETYEDAVDPEWRIHALSQILAAEIMANYSPSGYQPVLVSFTVATLSSIMEAVRHLPTEGDTIN